MMGDAEEFKPEDYPWTERPVTEEEWDMYAAELDKRGDAAHVLLNAAAIEEWLEKLLLCQMRNLVNTLAKKIFSGPLQSFSAKADLAYALKLIEEDTWCDLTAIKELRNTFAHMSNLLHFDSPAVLELFNQFKGWRPGELQAKRFFSERVAHSLLAIGDKIDSLIHLHATSDEKS